MSEQFIASDNRYFVVVDGNNTNKMQTDHLEDDNLIEYVEYENEAVNDDCNVNGNYSLAQHTLIITENADDSTPLYHCIDCGINYESIEDFTYTHDEKVEQSVEVADAPQWQLLEGQDDPNDLVEEIMPVQIVKTDYILDTQNTNNEEECRVKEECEDDANKYFCYDCQTVFDDLFSAEQHECNTSGTAQAVETISHNKKSKIPITKHYDNTATCNICNTTFNNEKNLKFHMRIHNKPEVKSIQDALPAGAQEEYNELNQFYCEICNKSFDQNLLTVHKNMHQNVLEYTCGVCNRNFENLVNYEMHMKLHAEKKPKKVKTNAVDAADNNASATAGKPPFACQYCGRTFGRPYEKVKHERIHTGEKPYECEVCGKTFRVTYSLTLHLRTHTNIRPYECETCKKRFKSYQVYAHHLRTHSAERMYSCDVCSKSFRTSVQLYSHKNSHTKPFNCVQCNRPFASLYAVKIHMKTHNRNNNENGGNSSGGSKSNEHTQCCSVCGAEYTRMFALRYHMRDAHGVELKPPTATVDDDVPTLELEDNFMTNEVAQSEAVLIAAAEQASCGIYMDTDSNGVMLQTLPENAFDSREVISETILDHEEFSVDNFQSEEVITDWLTK